MIGTKPNEKCVLIKTCCEVNNFFQFLPSLICALFLFVYGQCRTHYIVSQHSWPWFNIVLRHNIH